MDIVTSVVRTGIAVTVAATMACSSLGRNPSASRVDRNLLTMEQIRETRSTNAYDVVATLRSNWLLPRGIDSFSTPGQVLVYFNDTRLGGVDTLRGIALSQIGYIRHYDGREATARWGLDHGHGVIYIATLPPR